MTSAAADVISVPSVIPWDRWCVYLPTAEHPKAQSIPLGTTTYSVTHIPSYIPSLSSVPGSSTSASCHLPTKGENWHTLVININSIFGKPAAFHQMLTYIKPDVVLIRETKLNKDNNTAKVIPSNHGYTVYRRYRNYKLLSCVVALCYLSSHVMPPRTSLWAILTGHVNWYGLMLN